MTLYQYTDHLNINQTLEYFVVFVYPEKKEDMLIFINFGVLWECSNLTYSLIWLD